MMDKKCKKPGRRAQVIVSASERELQLEAELKAARETNRRLNRRLQQLESGEASEARREGYWELRVRADGMDKAWQREFERVIDAFRACKGIFEAVAPVLGLPHDRYHSVSDLPFLKKEGKPGRIYANVYLSEKGGIETFDIEECVRRAVGAHAGGTAPAGCGNGRDSRTLETP